MAGLLILLVFSEAEDKVDLAWAGARAGVASVGGVREATCDRGARGRGWLLGRTRGEWDTGLWVLLCGELVIVFFDELCSRLCPRVQYGPGPGSQLSVPGLTVSVPVSVCNIDHTPAGDYRDSARICTGPGRATLHGRRLVLCDHGNKINVNT
mgnify:CR=1 FL=1